LWRQVGTQEISNFAAFWSSDFWIEVVSLFWHIPRVSLNVYLLSMLVDLPQRKNSLIKLSLKNVRKT
jgi:hypothetical protein